MPTVSLLSGVEHKIDYTPTGSGSAVTAGDVVVAGDITLIASVDIAEDELGALAYPSGTATYKVPKSDASGAPAFALGDPVYWDVADVQANDDDTNPGLGYAAAAAGADQDYVLVVHDNVKAGAVVGSGA